MKRVIHVGCYFFILLLLALASFTSTYCESSFFSPTGIWSVLPPLVAIVLAFLTRNVIVSLLTGVFCASYLLALDSHGPIDSIPHCFLRRLDICARLRRSRGIAVFFFSVRQ